MQLVAFTLLVVHARARGWRGSGSVARIAIMVLAGNALLGVAFWIFMLAAGY